MSDVTQILSQIESGDPSAAAQFLPLVYDELRGLQRLGWLRRNRVRLCRRQLWCMTPICVWWMRNKARHWDSRGHFFAAAAEAIRRILMEARTKKRIRHGGSRERMDLEQALSLVEEVAIPCSLWTTH